VVSALSDAELALVGGVVVGDAVFVDKEESGEGAGLYRCCHLCGVVKTPPYIISCMLIVMQRDSLPSPTT
jgi:hypothetical protein